MAIAVGIGLLGWWADRALQGLVRSRIQDELQTLLNADVTALELWRHSQVSAVEVSAADEEIRQLALELVLLGDRAGATLEDLVQAPGHLELRQRLSTVADRSGYAGWIVMSRSGLVVASNTDEVVGLRLFAQRPLMQEALSGTTVLSPPFPAEIPLPEQADSSKREPTMFVATPIRTAAGQVVAVLAFRIQPRMAFNPIFRIARMGQSGETYAFDADGVMLSDSRFEAQLRRIGLLPDDSSVTAMLNVAVRDPGGNMLRGFVPEVPRRAQPLTRMAAAAVIGMDGVDVRGYRDYRGVRVVGAWRWLPELRMGIATEVDVAEAFGILLKLRRGFWALFALVLAAAIAIWVYSLTVARLHRSIRRAQRLGQYRLEEKIGEGGMGKVYRARHALLRRPTAVKLLRGEGVSNELVSRFEREVLLTSRLTHPNTIAIYDFGRTPDGVFYYAMEFLEGMTLDQLVARAGPQVEARVIHILRQACGSLAEAHAAGLIHRDIKPQNLMLCERGGLYDFVKVLDFGLVREIDQSESVAITAADRITGTPLYLSPEAIASPGELDERSDLYALGAVGYFLLTGRPVFTGNSVFEVCNHHINTPPESPSEQLGRRVADDLESLILRCLEKDRERRPRSATILLDELDNCADADGWGQDEARAWWEEIRSIGVQAAAWHVDFDETADGAVGSEPPTLVVDVGQRIRRSDSEE